MADAEQLTERYRPVEYPEERAYWDALRNHELRLQSCRSCGEIWYPVGPVCPHCLSDDFYWKLLSGHGRVSTYVVFHKPWAPWLKDRVPYVVAQVQTDEGPRLTTNLLAIDRADVRIGLDVQAAYEDIGDGQVLLQFTAAA